MSLRFPTWLKKSIDIQQDSSITKRKLKKYQLNTVCEEAKCPNRMECFAKHTATFLVLGNACTRNCAFCDIDFDKTPPKPDPNEPMHIASYVKDLKLKHVVITMVTRDDLPDQGANHLVKIIQKIQENMPKTTIEVLVSDFSGNSSLLDKVLQTKVEIFNHNIETVRRLSPFIRHKALYERSLEILKYAKNSNLCTFIKSGIMVGMGETLEEVKETIKDLYMIGCDIITIGQYLQPSNNKLKVKEYIHPTQFEELKLFGESLGVRFMQCGPFVRSSYNADQIIKKNIYNFLFNN